MEVYAVTDPGCLDAGAAMCVETGSWNDAEDAQGTAHFLEHMVCPHPARARIVTPHRPPQKPTVLGPPFRPHPQLFLGTAKYPDESEYDRFIKDHGGQMNAYTAADHTTYMLSVNNDAFGGVRSVTAMRARRVGS